MWTCPKCSEEIDDSFDVCWTCGTDTEGNQDPEFETADAPIDEPIAIEAFDADRLRCSNLVISNVNYGLGAIVTSFLFVFFLVVVFVSLWTSPELAASTARLPVLIIVGGGILLSIVRSFWVLSTAVMGIEFADRFVVRRIFSVSEYATSDIGSVEFEKELKAGLTSLLSGLRRLVTFVLADGQRIRIHIDETTESHIRSLIQSKIA